MREGEFFAAYILSTPSVLRNVHYTTQERNNKNVPAAFKAPSTAGRAKTSWPHQTIGVLLSKEAGNKVFVTLLQMHVLRIVFHTHLMTYNHIFKASHPYFNNMCSNYFSYCMHSSFLPSEE